MSAFLGISVWVALATVVPGLMTITFVFFAIVAVNPALLQEIKLPLEEASDWVLAGLGVTTMVVTQMLGILLERALVDKRCLGDELQTIYIEKGIDIHNETKIEIKPYAEYSGLYALLAEIEENEDTQGHLKRAAAQFFLTNNSLVSFGFGIFTAAIVFSLSPTKQALSGAAIYIGVLIVLIILTHKVAKIRFEVMAHTLWAARRRRLKAITTGKT